MKSDMELRRDVEAELEFEPSIDARQIGVAAENGVVTLTGTVRSFAEKWAAERVAGVRAIANEIEVDPIGVHNDAVIARQAADALYWNLFVPEDRIKVKVENGWITLKGHVSHDYERRAAERAVRNIPGVRGITNLIAVKPTARPEDMKAQIERSLRRLAVLDAENIQVEGDGSEVVLRGTVHSSIEKQEAERAAWSAPGVTSVKNLIAVEAAA